MNNKFDDYLHDYAVWTAARAVQRGFVNTGIICGAINSTGLKGFVQSPEITTPAEFDEFHQTTCQSMLAYWNEKGVEKGTYGRAAKIMNIYLKTSVVIPNGGKGILSSIIHPPIDRVLLKNIKIHHKGLGIKNISWTRFDQDQYFETINKLRDLPYDSLWEIEARYWSPDRTTRKNIEPIVSTVEN